MKPVVYLMLGLTGSGKSTFSKQLAKELGLERFAFDAEYERLGGNLRDHRWDRSIEDKTFNVMRHWMTERLKRGESVILDYCPWLKKDRAEFIKLITSLGATSHIYYFEVDHEEIWKRLSRRNETQDDSQYVTKEMLNDFIKRFEAPTDENVERVLQDS
jgi:predicted kinase